MNRAEQRSASHMMVRRATLAMILLLGFACAGAAQVDILAPVQHDTVHENSGTMRVDVKVEPSKELEEGVSIRILLDGKPASADSAGTSFTLEGVERGEHWLQALLIDRQGQTSAVSETIYFTMWQASVNNPARKRNANR